MDENEEPRTRDRGAKMRDLVSFWIFGLCNNYGYVVMLTAAIDILHSDSVRKALSTNYFKIIEPNLISANVPHFHHA